MPYAKDYMGVYRVVDGATGSCYVGQSRRVRKRVAEHFRLLNLGIHPNRPLQAAYDAHPDEFDWCLEVRCDDPNDMDTVEEAFLSGEAMFNSSPKLFNISSTARTPMSGRRHTDATRARISESKRGRVDHVTDAYRERLSIARKKLALADPVHRERVKFIVRNPHLSYAERGRRVGLDTSTTRRLALNYANCKELLDG